MVMANLQLVAQLQLVALILAVVVVWRVIQWATEMKERVVNEMPVAVLSTQVVAVVTVSTQVVHVTVG